MMPQNESGKLDRKSLGQWVEAMDRALFETLAASSRDSDPARTSTPLEKQIQAAWAEALNISLDRVSVERRSFLSLGGDSISAMQVVSRCRAQGVSLVVRDILQSKSIAQLALKAGGAMKPVVEGAEFADEPFQLSPVQQWYFETVSSIDSGRQHGGDYRYNQSICLRTRNCLAVQAVIDAANAVVFKHPMLRSRFHFESTGGWRQNIVGDINASYSFQHHDVGNREEAEELIAAAQGRLDPERGPVFCARLINISADGAPEQLLFMAAHHL
jgi:aryl carrier-like protein